MKTSLDLFRNQTWNPWKELSSMQKSLERMLGDTSLSKEGSFEFGLPPLCDMEESENEYRLKMDMPGIPKDRIKIEITGDTLHVVGEHQQEKRDSKDKRRFVERYEGRVERTFTLPGIASGEKVQADFVDGVLTITLPKAAASKTHQIKIGEKKADRPGESRAA